MPRFKVTVERSLGIYGGTDRPLNPFEIRDIFSPLLHERKSLRVFEFDAKDEAEVQWYFDEAVKADTPEIRGYKIRSIEQAAG